jgi:peptidoglycan LD-endopeptidase LytH
VAAGRETSRVEAAIAQQAAAAKAAADARARAAAATSTTTAASADAPSGVASGTPTSRHRDPPPTRPSPPKTPDTKPSEPTQPTPPPPPPTRGGGVLCPIRGPVSFVDSWGAARSGGRHHEGVDMMAPMNAINQAVVSGTQKYGSRQGNGVFLSGDDGNSYWYFHLSSYAGGPRHVAKGEVIGYVGMTGNADGTVPHTHFEYHPGHGAAVDPYPLVKAACG